MFILFALNLVPCTEIPVVKKLVKCETVEDEISTLPGFRALVRPDGSVKIINQQTAEDAQFMKDGSIVSLHRICVVYDFLFSLGDSFHFFSSFPSKFKEKFKEGPGDNGE